jgi:hypothetical protein
VHRLIGAKMVWCGLPTSVPCAAGVKGDGGGGMWVERSGLGSGAGRIECGRQVNAIAHGRKGIKALR